MDALKLFHRLPPDYQKIFLEGPALAPPNNVKSNFTNPANKNEIGWAITAAGLGLATASILLRLYVKIFCIKKFQLEDCKTTSHTFKKVLTVTRYCSYGPCMFMCSLLRSTADSFPGSFCRI